jgi:hypothetical protein
MTEMKKLTRCLCTYPGIEVIFLVLQILGEASRITGYSFSPQNNVVHPTVVQGTKTTVSSLLHIFVLSYFLLCCNVIFFPCAVVSESLLSLLSNIIG